LRDRQRLSLRGVKELDGGGLGGGLECGVTHRRGTGRQAVRSRGNRAAEDLRHPQAARSASMVLKSRLSKGLNVVAALAITLTITCVALFPVMTWAQAKTNPSPVAPGQPKAGKISEEDLRKLRIAELKSGARTKANEAPEVQTLKGPPLNDREKVIHVLNRLSFGPRPGDVDKVLENGGWEKWVEAQLEPEKIADSYLDDELPQRFPYLKMTLSEMRSKYPIGENTYNNPELRQGVTQRGALPRRHEQPPVPGGHGRLLAEPFLRQPARPRRPAAVVDRHRLRT
jgi:hypothetical protein